jgi:hypothetical protein
MRMSYQRKTGFLSIEKSRCAVRALEIKTIVLPDRLLRVLSHIPRRSAALCTYLAAPLALRTRCRPCGPCSRHASLRLLGLRALSSGTSLDFATMFGGSFLTYLAVRWRFALGALPAGLVLARVAVTGLVLGCIV